LTLVFSSYTLCGMESRGLHTLHERFQLLARLAAELESTPRHYGTDELLTPSEIHLVERIGDQDQSLSVTDLARLVGVTKGAISQTLKKLARKQIVRKDSDPHNSSRTLVSLTAKGKAAFYAHMHWHETVDGGFKEFFMNLSQDQVDFLIETLSRLEVFYRQVMK